MAPHHIVAASALIRNRTGHIALVKTERRGWELPGGQIEAGESLTEGLMREIDEECGIQVELGRLIQVRNNLSSSIVVFCFQAAYISGDLRPSEETPEARWASSEKALELIAHPILRLSLLDLLRTDGAVLVQAYTDEIHFGWLNRARFSGWVRALAYRPAAENGAGLAQLCR